MSRSQALSLFVLVSLLGLGVSTTAHAGVPEELTAYKTAASELKTLMAAITDEATAKKNAVRLEAAVIAYNKTGAALDASLVKLDLSNQDSAKLYESTMEQMQTASQEVATQSLRLMSSPAISAVITGAIGKLTR